MNALEFSRIIGSIDEKCFTERDTAKKARRLIKPLIAAASVSIFCIAALLGSGLFSRSTPKTPVFTEGYEFMERAAVNESAVLPPAQNGCPIDISYLRGYGFASAYAEAPYVCAVTVGNWVSENDFCTYYEATVEKNYKGELPRSILIYQLGSSRNPSSVAPFTYGDKLLLFLQEWENSIYENTYEIVGADIGCLYAAADTHGNVYFMDLLGLLSMETRDSGEELPEDGAKDGALRNALSLYYSGKPVSELIRQCGSIYSAESVERLFAELGKE